MPGPDHSRFAIVIPARFQSSRFPGKPLAELRGATGHAKSLIRRSWETAVAACAPDRVWVATDDDRIADAVRAFGGQVAMTSSTCRNGTERCAAALDQIGTDIDIVVNLQGDAPLTPAFLVEKLVASLSATPSAAMATPALRCSPSTYDHLAADNAAGRVGGTTVVFDRSNRALYFSKRIIPFVPADAASPASNIHLHLGLYAYRRQALLDYAAAAPSPLELVEGLEQLRFLSEGQHVQVVAVDPVDWDCIELNNPGDVPAIEGALRARGIE